MTKLTSLPPEHAPPSDEQSGDWALIHRVGTHDVAAFERLYLKYYDYLYRFIFQVMRRSEFVEDVINEVMLVVWRKASAVIPQAKASTWILGIAYKLSLKFIEQNRITAHSSGLIDETIEEREGIDGIAGVESNNLLLAALKLLSEDQRAALELLFYHGLHYRDIAAILGCNENTAKTRIYYARAKLRDFRAQLMGAERSLRGHR